MPKYHVFVTADKHWKETLLVLSGEHRVLESKLAENSLWFSHLGSVKEEHEVDALVQVWEEKGRPRQFGMLHSCWGCGKKELALFNLLVRELERYSRQLEEQDGGVFRLLRFEISPLQLQEMVSAMRVWGKAEVKVEAVYSRVEMKEGGFKRDEVKTLVPFRFPPPSSSDDSPAKSAADSN